MVYTHACLLRVTGVCTDYIAPRHTYAFTRIHICTHVTCHALQGCTSVQCSLFICICRPGWRMQDPAQNSRTPPSVSRHRPFQSWAWAGLAVPTHLTRGRKLQEALLAGAASTPCRRAVASTLHFLSSPHFLSHLYILSCSCRRTFSADMLGSPAGCGPG